jgi:hypothetical protein
MSDGISTFLRQMTDWTRATVEEIDRRRANRMHEGSEETAEEEHARGGFVPGESQRSSPPRVVKPITPEEAVANKQQQIPEAVIKVFNDLIVENLVNGTATVQQKVAVDAILSKLNVSSDVIFKKGWLNVEPLFRAAGWEVKYDKPCYNESFEAYFEFTVFTKG